MPKKHKLSTKGIAFLSAQKCFRKMFFGSKDPVESKRLNKLKKRKHAEALEQQNDYTRWRYEMKR